MGRNRKSLLSLSGDLTHKPYLVVSYFDRELEDEGVQEVTFSVVGDDAIDCVWNMTRTLLDDNGPEDFRKNPHIVKWKMEIMLAAGIKTVISGEGSHQLDKSR